MARVGFSDAHHEIIGHGDGASLCGNARQVSVRAKTAPPRPSWVRVRSPVIAWRAYENWNAPRTGPWVPTRRRTPKPAPSGAPARMPAGANPEHPGRRAAGNLTRGQRVRLPASAPPLERERVGALDHRFGAREHSHSIDSSAPHHHRAAHSGARFRATNGERRGRDLADRRPTGPPRSGGAQRRGRGAHGVRGDRVTRGGVRTQRLGLGGRRHLGRGPGRPRAGIDARRCERR